MEQNYSLKIGATLQNGKFVVRSILGQGGFGITYEVEQVNLEKRMVLKELFISGTCDRDDDGNTVFVLRSSREFFQKQKKRFLNEAKRIAKLSNSHIVQVYDMFEENSTAYYVMDFIEGKSFADIIKRSGNPLDEKRVHGILYQMLEALACIHSQNPPLCHLDIKPANIMMREDGQVVLIDFGASKYVTTDDEERSSSSSFAYTPGYSPLEQLAGIREDMGPWTDFYALGATLFNLLTTKRPPSPSVVNDDHSPNMRDSIPLPETLSVTMRYLVLWMMSPSKNNRPQSVEEIRAFLKDSEMDETNLSNASETSESSNASETSESSNASETSESSNASETSESSNASETSESSNASETSESSNASETTESSNTSETKGSSKVSETFESSNASETTESSNASETSVPSESFQPAKMEDDVVVEVVSLGDKSGFLEIDGGDESTDVLGKTEVSDEQVEPEKSLKSEPLDESDKIDGYDELNESSTLSKWLKPASMAIAFVLVLLLGWWMMNSEDETKTKEEILQNLIGNMVYVEGGTFTMGATSEQGSDAKEDEIPTHEVTLSSFSIGKYEVTQEEWETVMGSSSFKIKGANLPVENVSWEDCQEFIDKLNELTGKSFRLPTEAEWEYAARGGNKSKHYKYAGADTLSAVAWYDGNDGIHPVGQKSPNELGLYDMSGNVWEWCQDWYRYSYYEKSPSTNPCNTTPDSSRVYRGGGWGSLAWHCRLARRNYYYPNCRNRFLGLRLAL